MTTTTKRFQFVIGLPGSGKTSYIGNTLINTAFGCCLGILDDASKTLMDSNLDFQTYLESDEVKKSEGLIISDPWFCGKQAIRKAITWTLEIYPGSHIRQVYFENAPDKCKKNVRYRNDGREVIKLIDILSKEYEVPHTIDPLPIWQPNENN